jgi:hypothetical protein
MVFAALLLSALVHAPTPAPSPRLPFRPNIETYTMGTYGTLPQQALRVGKAWFLEYNHGEFGGALWVFNADGSVGTRLLATPTYDLVRYGDEVLAATGSAAPFFFKPLRIHRFAYRSGTWREIGHVDFPYNIVELKVIDGKLYGDAVMQPGQLTHVQISLCGTVRPLGSPFAPAKPSPHVVMAPASVAATSADGTWMFAQYGPHLLHFSNGQWHEMPVPVQPSTFLALQDRPVAWSLNGQDSNWFATATRRGGTSMSVDLHVHAPIEEAPMIAAGPSGDAWFTIPDAPYLGHINAQGALSRVQLSSPAAFVQSGNGAAWFTESDHTHYGFVDANANAHEFSWRKGFPITGILPALHGAWLEETFPGERRFYRHIKADGSPDQNVYLPDVGSGIIAPDGTLYARSTKWPTILQMSEDGALSSYRLPCAGGFLRLLNAPDNGVWFKSPDPGCSGIIENGEIHVRNFPLVRTVYYQ